MACGVKPSAFELIRPGVKSKSRRRKVRFTTSSLELEIECVIRKFLLVEQVEPLD